MRSKLLLILVSILLLSGCVPRLPERNVLASSDIPALEEGKGRIYVHRGYIEVDDFLIDTTIDMLGIDGHIYVEDKLVSHFNEDVIIIDLVPGIYKFNWVPYVESESQKKERNSVPYSLSINVNETVYLEANTLNVVNAGVLGVVGGAIGAAIAGSSAKFSDSFEEEPVEGPKMVESMSVAEYHDLSPEK